MNNQTDIESDVPSTKEADQQQRDEHQALTKAIDEARTGAEMVRAEAFNLTQEAQSVIDTADTLNAFVQEVPPAAISPELRKDMQSRWDAMSDTNRSVLGSISQPIKRYGQQSRMIALSTSTSTASISIADIRIAFSPRAEAAYARMEALVDRESLYLRVCGRMQEIGLDRAPSERHSPLALVKRAMSLMGAGGTEEVLLAIRSALDDTVADLLQRRPTQEPAKGMVAKIASLGNQCAKVSVDAQIFDDLGKDAARLHDSLSTGKTKVIARHDIAQLINGVLQLLSILLESIDPTKLRH